MAFFAKKSHRAIVSNSPRAIELDRIGAPEKIVIVTEHPFSGALKYLVVGALAGAGATYFVLRGRIAAHSARATDVAPASVKSTQSTQSAKTAERDLLGRAAALTGRVKGLAGAVRGVAEFASDTVRPAIEAAMSEGRRTAHEVEEELKSDLEEAKAESEAEAKDAQKKRDED